MSQPSSSDVYSSDDGLLEAFRANYFRFEQAIHNAVTETYDSVVLARLGDDVDEYLSIANEVSPAYHSCLSSADTVCSMHISLTVPSSRH